ncbi:MAG: GTPase ObgE [Dehalococcoidia bacterium]
MIDRVEIVVKAGAGGDGVVSFRREKFVPRGGPNGGDGGDGGDVVLCADRSVRTLAEMGRRRQYRAPRGQHGQGSTKHGRNGEDMVLKVPPGTVATAIEEDGTETILADLQHQGQKAVVAEGGAGGWGNTRFANSIHQAPRIAQKGAEGDEVRLRLDLKLLADVGIAGLPNAGKSTLLTGVSAARPKIGSYPFTTIEPNLGVVDVGWERFVMADIPGLIEGAHEGAGLGLDFLRHIERTRLVLHLIDGSSPDPVKDMETVNAELREYGQGLAERRQIIVINKTDIPEVAEKVDELRLQFAAGGTEVTFISGASGDGVSSLMETLATRLSETEDEEPEAAGGEAELPVLRPLEGRVKVRENDGVYEVVGAKAVSFAETMPLESDEGRAEVWRRFQRWGVTGALRRAGARAGDRVRLGRVELEMQ